MPPRVFLTGFMASGKSSVGVALARVLGYTFVDLDRLVVERAGRTIPELFEEGGEPAFRTAEAAALEEAAARPRVVVATGGGALVSAENRALAKSAGLVVYLRLTPEALAARLVGRRTRPLVLGDDGEPLPPDALLERVRTLLAARAEAYEQADLVVDVGAASPREVAARVGRLLRRRR